MFHREFLWPTSAKWVQTLIFCIIVIKNGLNNKRSLHSRLNFMFLVQLLIFLWLVMTCVIPSQMAYSFIISNASHSMHFSSVEACLLWKCCSECSVSHQIVLISDSWLLHTCSHKPWIAWDILLVLITVAINLCNKCPKWLLKQNNSYSDYFNVISGLYRTAEPQEALWHYCKTPGLNPVLPRGVHQAQRERWATY